MSAHTPTPWIVQTPMTGDDLVIEACPGLEYHELARVRAPQYGQGANRDEMRANAAHIVLCVNAHDALVDALRDARRALSVAIRSAWEGSTDADVAENHVVKKIDLALSKSVTSTEGGAR